MVWRDFCLVFRVDWIYYSVPLHSVMPSPSNPSLHLHVYEPAVLMQSAVLWQGVPSSHSFLSNKKKSINNLTCTIFYYKHAQPRAKIRNWKHCHKCQTNSNSSLFFIPLHKMSIQETQSADCENDAVLGRANTRSKILMRICVASSQTWRKGQNWTIW